MSDIVPIPEAKLQGILARHSDITAQLMQSLSTEATIALSKELSDLNPIVDSIRAYHAAVSELAGLDALMADSSTDPEMRAMAEEERPEAMELCDDLLRALKLMLLPKDAADDKSAILEVRAGTGGDEASLFAGDLFRMYARYADLCGWKVDVISESEGASGGYKEIVAEVRGKGVFARMKFESGVHRVQRVPDTETSGRVHTSAATVAVLPEAEDVDVSLHEDDLRIDTLRSSGAGGQHVNKTESAVRIVHVPTGVMVLVQEGRSQHKNKAQAMTLLRSKLFELERNRIDSQRSAARKALVGSGDRSERIRTYNFPQGRVSDHRINLTLYKLDQVMLGHMDELVNALITEHHAMLLAADGEE